MLHTHEALASQARPHRTQTRSMQIRKNDPKPDTAHENEGRHEWKGLKRGI